MRYQPPFTALTGWYGPERTTTSAAVANGGVRDLVPVAIRRREGCEPRPLATASWGDRRR
jgi:hypothetical protein